MPKGRPSKLTRALCDELGEHLAQGYTHRGACSACRISPTTYYGWLRRAQELARTADTAPDRALYLHLLDAVSRGEARCKAEMLAVIRRATADERDGWRAAAWLLAHAYPAEYGGQAALAVATMAEASGGEARATGQVVVYLPDNGRGGISAEDAQEPL